MAPQRCQNGEMDLDLDAWTTFKFPHSRGPDGGFLITATHLSFSWGHRCHAGPDRTGPDLQPVLRTEIFVTEDAREKKLDSAAG